jgi:hypothetical protein
MPAAPPHPEEARRIAALHALSILDTGDPNVGFSKKAGRGVEAR